MQPPNDCFKSSLNIIKYDAQAVLKWMTNILKRCSFSALKNAIIIDFIEILTI